MSWSTYDEIAFIDGLGFHRTNPMTEDEIKEALLAYRSSMRRRADWGTVDPDVVRDHVAKQLASFAPTPQPQPKDEGDNG